MSKYCMGCMEQLEDHINICPHCGYIEGSAAAQALHMQPGSILRERYIVGTSLGFGGFGVTYIAWDALLEQKVAIKEYLPSEFSTRMPGVTQITVYTGDKSKQFYDGLDRFVDEAKRLAKLQDVDGIVHIYDCFKENKTAYIVMEYLEGETLAQILKKEKRYAPDEAIAMLLPVIDSLAKVHEHGIIHRDIAPDNIFVTKDDTMKVIDFGAARYATTSHSRSLTVIIKPGYSPEEQYRSKSDQGSHTDVYALAATLYKMITGKTPPDALERRAFFENKKKDILKPLSVYCTDIDDSQENAILNAMNVRIEDRTPTMAAFKDELTSTAPVKRIVGKIRKIDLLRWPLWAKITMPIAACLILTFGVLFGTGVIKFESNLRSDVVIPDGMTRVPSVVNNTLESADTRLTEAVLLYMISGKEYSDDIPADYVLTQDVSAGSIVVENSIVNIIVSGGDSDAIEKDFMADLTYMTEDKAKEILKSQGFTPEITYTTSETVGAGLVISQNIELGKRLGSGDKIQLVVSTGQPSFAMPNVIGKSEDDARTVLSDKGLTCVVEYVFSNTVAKGNVIKQSIIEDTQVRKGYNVTITVSNGAVSMTSISVKTMPTKTSYYENQTLNTSGLTLTAKYNDGSTKTISSGFTCSPTSFSSGGVQTITVSYGGKTATFDVNVQEVYISSISVQKKPTKTTYFIGDTLDTSGLELTAKFNYGATMTGITNNFTCTPTKLTTAGTQTVTVTYQGKSTTFTVTVQNVSLTRISVNTPPTKTGYSVGETLNTSGLVLNAFYSNGTTQTISSGFTCSPTSLNSAGVQSITVSYGGMSTHFYVTVFPKEVTLESISIRTNPTKTSYNLGDTLNTSGLTLTAKYNDGSTKTITSGFTCSPTKLNIEGTQVIVVLYNGCKDTFTVQVKKEEVTLVKTLIGSLPNKTVYTVGEKLDITGLTLIEYYSDGTTKTVNDTYIASPNITFTEAGTREIYIAGENGSIAFNVTVKPKETTLESISIRTNPTKTTYYVGETLNTSGLTLTAKYNDGSTKTISSGFTCNPTSLTSAGTQRITVSYGGKSTWFDATVTSIGDVLQQIQPVSLLNLKVRTHPTKTIYYVGEDLDTSGLTLLADYVTGSQVLTSGFTCSPTSFNSTGTKTITVTYGGKSTTFTVTVHQEPATLARISVKAPKKTIYNVGETLDTSGLVLTAHYSDGSTKTISSGFICSPTSLNSTEIYRITVSYGGKSTWFEVAVRQTPVALTSISVKTQPTKTLYYAGETLNTSGLTLTAKYNDGSTKTISSGFTCNPTLLTSAGTKTITVSYGEKSTSFNVNVQEDAIKSISSTRGSIRMTDTGVTITQCDSNVTVYDGINLSVNTSWTYTPCVFTVSTYSTLSQITVSSSNSSVATASVTQNGNQFTVKVDTNYSIPYNTNLSATIYINLNGKQKATYTVDVYRLHSLKVETSSNNLVYITGNPFEGGSIYAVGTCTSPTSYTPSNVATLTVTTANGNTAKTNITVNTVSSFTTNTTYNVRSGAGTNYSVVGSISQGVSLKVYGTYWDGSQYMWGYISHNGVSGWVAINRYSG